MNEESERRLARNEALFRKTNEAIARGHWPDDPRKPVRFRCECSRMECDQAVEIALVDYERVRSFPRRFVLVSGHETPQIETVVDRGERHVVVEKPDAAGDVAAATDPRR
jgi:hypothetical protein